MVGEYIKRVKNITLHISIFLCKSQSTVLFTCESVYKERGGKGEVAGQYGGEGAVHAPGGGVEAEAGQVRPWVVRGHLYHAPRPLLVRRHRRGSQTKI